MGARTPQRARPPIREVGVTTVKKRNFAAATRQDRTHESNRVPPAHEHRIRLRLFDGGADLGNIDSPKPFTPEDGIGGRRANHFAAVPLAKRNVPQEVRSELSALLTRRGLGRVEHAELELTDVSRDKTKPRRVVLDRVRHHHGEANWRAHEDQCSAAATSRTSASRPAIDRAEYSSTTSRSNIDSSTGGVVTRERSSS